MSVGMEVLPSSSTHCPWLVPYHRSLGLPPSPTLGPSRLVLAAQPPPIVELVTVFPKTTVANHKGHTIHPAPLALASGHSARLARTRACTRARTKVGDKVIELPVTQWEAQRTAVCNLDGWIL